MVSTYGTSGSYGKRFSDVYFIFVTFHDAPDMLLAKPLINPQTSERHCSWVWGVSGAETIESLAATRLLYRESPGRGIGHSDGIH